MRKFELILLSVILVTFCGSGFAQTNLVNTEWKFAATDSLFAQPYVDIDEWRDEPVRHRYVHGGFEGTQTRFSFYFPQEENYEGRFFQYITPVKDSENLSQGATGKADKIFFLLNFHKPIKGIPKAFSGIQNRFFSPN
jgi:hypothetical protein